MANITVSLPTDLKQRMNSFKDINWSAVAREAIESKLKMLSVFDALLKHSDLTEEDIAKEVTAIKKRVWKKHTQRR